MSLWKMFKECYPKADETKFKTTKFLGKETIMFIAKDEDIDVSMGIILEALFISQMK